MKNLIHLGERRRRLDFLGNESVGEKSHLVDTCQVVTEEIGSEPSIVVLTNDGKLSRIINTNHDGDIDVDNNNNQNNNNVLWTCNLQEFNKTGWFNVSFVDPEIVCLSHNGAIVTVSPTTGEAELVGEFDYGLQAASWSPDGEVLIMVTSAEDEEDDTKINSVLLSMNSQLEVLAEVPIPQYVPYDLDNSEDTTNRISVAWRPDGSLCSVCSVDLEDQMRKIRIYKRETLELSAIGRSEDASGTLIKNIQPTAVSWAGPGCSQLLAAVQRKTKKTQQVIFYESNGLRHREFVLREAASTSVLALNWNVNSDLLAIALREDNGDGGIMDKTQIWHRCNYHWYMKQEFRYPSAGQKIEKIMFDEEDSYLLRVVFQNSFEWREYLLRWDPSTTWNIGTRCLAFVIDGCSLNLTPFEKALIPPPMSMNTVKLPYPVNQLIFHDNSEQSGIVFAALSNGSIAVLDNGSWTNSTKATPKMIEWGEKDETDMDKLRLRSLCIVGNDETDEVVSVVAVACSRHNQKNENLVEIAISGFKNIENENAKANIVKSHPVDGCILRLVNWSDCSSGCLVELDDGSLFEYDHDGKLSPLDIEPLLEPCPWIHGIKDVSPFEHENEHSTSDISHSRMVFGLSARSRLYCHDIMLTDSASSFSVSMPHEYLCYATAGSRCQMRFLPLKEVTSFDPLMGMDQNHLLQGYEPRNVERGARIVAILPGRPMAVLQMPRGNLEGIYPRALVLHSVMSQIMNGDYGNAFRLMRTHKVDLNLIVDMNPVGFIENGLARFFEQVLVIDHINLFISGLQDWDITIQSFQIPGWFRKENMADIDSSSFDFTTKVNQVCSKARQTMLGIEGRGEKEEGHFLLPVLSTFAKENPPRLDEALSMIKENALRIAPSSAVTSTKKNPLFSEKAQGSIHYLAFLAEYELLFNTALGMYDYDLARAVARNSQMDPKVYLPLLKRLVALPDKFAKYEVDIRLKRYDDALKNLVASHKSNEQLEESLLSGDQTGENKKGNAFESCMFLIETHCLHSLGLQLFKDDSDKSHQIYISLGESKLKESRADVALSVFLAAEPPNRDGAKRAARAVGDWRCFFSLLMEEEDEIKASGDVAEDPSVLVEKRRQVARDIADFVATADPFNASRSRQDKHLDAARILLDYGDDLIGAVDLLLAAELWSETHRIATMRERPELVKRCVDTATSYAYSAMEECDERVSGFSETNTKYATVLKLRKKIVATEGPDVPEAFETDSLFSVATTASNMSLRSTGSMGSTASNVTSSVISVKSSNTFTVVGTESASRHRSKFNKDKKKKKKKKPRKNRRRPGSEEEVNELAGSLKASCPDKTFAHTIAETIRFLIFVRNYSLSRDLFQRYNTMCSLIEKSRVKRIEDTALEKAEAERRSRHEGDNSDDVLFLVDLPVEKEVDGLSCARLPESLVEFFNVASFGEE